jgi:hypothetical protein
MGAFWHIALPVEIRFEETKEMSAFVETTYGDDFLFDHVEEYQVQSPKLPDGKRLTFDRREKIYRVNTTVWKTEFRAMYLAFFEAFQAYSVRRKYQIYSVALDQQLLTPFLQQFKAIDLQDEPDQCAERLESLDDNYFIHFYDLPHMVVYHGYPLPISDSSSMKIFSLLTSHKKMQVIPEETVMFQNAVEEIKVQLHDAYRLSRYLFVAGY